MSGPRRPSRGSRESSRGRVNRHQQQRRGLFPVTWAGRPGPEFHNCPYKKTNHPACKWPARGLSMPAPAHSLPLGCRATPEALHRSWHQRGERVQKHSRLTQLCSPGSRSVGASPLTAVGEARPTLGKMVPIVVSQVQVETITSSAVWR